MIIHKSHSRKELINVIQIFELPIKDVIDLNKNALIQELVNCLATMESVKPDYTEYRIETLEELRIFLQSPNVDKSLTINEKSKTNNRLL